MKNITIIREDQSSFDVNEQEFSSPSFQRTMREQNLSVQKEAVPVKTEAAPEKATKNQKPEDK